MYRSTKLSFLASLLAVSVIPTLMMQVVRASVFNMGPGLTSLELVRVGNPGNEGERSGDTAPPSIPGATVGDVNYSYRIGKYEVTAGQYTRFLNAVASTDTYGLYNEIMDYDVHHNDQPQLWWGCNIKRTGSPGSYSYSVAADWSNRPVNWVSWGDAARFVNWLANGQPGFLGYGLNGEPVFNPVPQDKKSTEDGSYKLEGATSNVELMTVTRKTNATWVIPSEDEWVKAAYYDPNKLGGAGYWDYPTSRDQNMSPSNDLIEPDSGNNATFYAGASWPDPTGYTIGPPYYRTEVGAHENTKSPYGAYDTAGNVWEWTETIVLNEGTPQRNHRGGSFTETVSDQHAEYRLSTFPTHESATFGFRVANVRLTSVRIVADYNLNGVVDAADYSAWRDQVGKMFTLPNENPIAVTPGLVDHEDYEFWKASFGLSADSDSFTESTTPEPTSMLLLILAAMGGSFRRSRGSTVKCLAMMAELSQSLRRRMLERATKLNRV